MLNMAENLAAKQPDELNIELKESPHWAYFLQVATNMKQLTQTSEEQYIHYIQLFETLRINCGAQTPVEL